MCMNSPKAPDPPKAPPPPIPPAPLLPAESAEDTAASAKKLGKKKLQIPLNAGKSSSGLGIPV